MTQTKERQIKRLIIRKGPSKFDLMVALFDKKKITFIVSEDCGTKDCYHRWSIVVRIRGIVSENEEILSICGEITKSDKHSDEHQRCGKNLTLWQIAPFTGGYNIRHHEGIMRVGDENNLRFFSTEEKSEREKDVIWNYLNPR